jgi:hypothetical protein
MKRTFLFLIVALLAPVPKAFAALAGTASSFQISRQLACDDAKHKATMDADSDRNTETFGKKVKSANTTISECRCDAPPIGLRAALIGHLVFLMRSEE